MTQNKRRKKNHNENTKENPKQTKNIELDTQENILSNYFNNLESYARKNPDHYSPC